MNWMFHVKKNKYDFVNLNDYWIKNLKFFKIQTIVLNLLKQQNVLNDNWHIIWLNNFFKSIWLLTILKNLKFETTRIVKIIKIKRKKNKKKTTNQIKKKKKKKKKKIRELNSNFNDFKLKSNNFKRVDFLCFDNCEFLQNWNRVNNVKILLNFDWNFVVRFFLKF